VYAALGVVVQPVRSPVSNPLFVTRFAWATAVGIMRHAIKSFFILIVLMSLMLDLIAV
jgi:hypothetical protein